MQVQTQTSVVFPPYLLNGAACVELRVCDRAERAGHADPEHTCGILVFMTFDCYSCYLSRDCRVNIGGEDLVPNPAV